MDWKVFAIVFVVAAVGVYVRSRLRDSDGPFKQYWNQVVQPRLKFAVKALIYVTAMAWLVIWLIAEPGTGDALQRDLKQWMGKDTPTPEAEIIK